jgi:ABC-type phosphate/phosphonate transport system permease subunit
MQDWMVFDAFHCKTSKIGEKMPFWKRLLITIIAMLAASFVAGLIWKAIFDTFLPSYIGGIIGGLAALPVWEFLSRVGPKD